MGRIARTIGLVAGYVIVTACLSACQQEGGEPDNLPPADAAAVSADGAVSGTAVSEAALPKTVMPD